MLAKLEKNHTRRDFLEAVELTRANRLALQPTFIAFTPWTTIEGYRDFLRTLADLELVENVQPVQLALRLLITLKSRLLELEDIDLLAFDPKSLVHPWKHRNPAVDHLAAQAFKIVARKATRSEIFRELAALVSFTEFHLPDRAAIPFLNEPWYC